MSSSYLRYPHLHGDLVTFVAADDVWLAPLAGGRAWRLTHDRVPVSHPRFSPDGQHVAWLSTRDGHHEVMVVEVDGGAPRRLTWWGTAFTAVLGWTADGRVLAASSAGESEPRHRTVRAVGLDGTVERLPYGIVSGVAVGPKGAVAVSTPWSRPPAHWKRYRGGTAPRLWLDRKGRGDWERLFADERAALTEPLWVGDTLVVTSDRGARFPDRADEQADLYAVDLGRRGPSLRRLTHQDASIGYVRDASTDGRRVVWHSRGVLYVLDGLKATPRRLEIELPGVAPAPVVLTPTENLDAIVPDHGGDASVVSWRGKAFWLTHRDGPARALVADAAVRVREPQPVGRTGQAVLVGDADGHDTVELHPVRGDGAPSVLADGLGQVLHLLADPQGRWVAVISHDGAVRVIDVAKRSVRDLGRSEEGEAEHPCFSPDGRYLAWSQPVRGEGHHRIMAVDLDRPRSKPVALTSGRFHDTHPTFTRDGRYLALLSGRTFDPRYDEHSFDLSFASSVRPWLAPLSAVDPAPFGPSADGWRISVDDQPDDKAGDQGGKASEVVSADLDVDGFEERLLAFPVVSGAFRGLQSTKDGVVWIREGSEAGVLGSVRAGVSGEPAGDALEAWSFPTRRAEVLAEKVDDARVSGDGSRVVVRSGDTVTVRPTDRPLKDDDDKDLVTVDLSRLRCDIEPRVEWRQMFEENARIMREHFWRADLDGVAWDAAVERYRGRLDGLASHDDLVDLLWECVGELNTSHAYVMPKPAKGTEQRRLGLLGADLSPARGGWRIDRVLPGESSDPDARSPLRAAGVDARAGDLIVAVDGRPVDPVVGPAALLVGAVDKPVELTLRRRDRDRRVVVVPLGSEEALRYQDWVRSRTEYVARVSKGRLGYVHIPDMQSKGWAQLHRDLELATRAEGTIVDVRYNRGGHTSQLVVEKLGRRVIGWNIARHYATAGSYPDTAPRGPVVLVANEFSGSDGDIVNAAAQQLKIGPVVGARTWGGVVGIDGRFSLVDGTGITQPRYAYWFANYGWGVENNGIDPDIEVVHSPSDFHSDDDPQLDRAIAEAIDRLATTPAATPPPLPESKVR